MLRKVCLSFLILNFYLTVRGQQVSLYQQFLGKYDFTMIGNTMNTIPNGQADCVILTSSSASLNLGFGQEIEAAYLYWAGSGGNSIFDFSIKLNGQSISPDRNFESDFLGREISGGFTDVTAQVKASGNGVYTVSDFDLNSIIIDYCDNGTNFGGWTLLIVYKDLTLGNNLVNIYDGFSRVDANNTYLQFQLNNLNVLHLQGNRIGFLAWEGDENIAVQEQLKVNGNVVSNPPLNPANNVFNGSNSFTNENTLYNMDMDVFDISGFTTIGDNSMTVSMESHQDAVIINNMVVVLNSEVPDATITGTAEYGGCDNFEVKVNYTVYNTIATDILPASTPIAFYANDTLVGISAIVNDIPIAGSEDGQITLTIPTNIPSPFNLKLSVDDDGTGNGAIIEFNENNNSYQIQINLGITPQVNEFDTLQKCDTNNNGIEIFDLTLTGSQMIGSQTGVIIRYYTSESDAEQGNANNINNPNAYTGISSPQTIFVRMEDAHGCFVVTAFQIEIVPPAMFDYPLTNLETCSPNLETTGIPIDLNQRLNEILNGNNPDDFVVSFHTSQSNAMSGANPIPNSGNFQNSSSPQIIWARMLGTDGCVLFGSFEIIINPATPITYQIPVLEVCSADQSTVGHTTDLTQNENSILNGNNPADYEISYYLNQNSAVNGINQIPDPENFVNTASPQTIWVRMVGNDGCVLYGSFDLLYNLPPLAIPAVIEECSISGPALFDLTELNPLVVNNVNNLNFSYYLTQDDAQNQSNPLSLVYTPPTQSYTIFVRIEDQKGCFTIVEADLETITNSAELTNTYFECDSPWEVSDGFTTFDLTTINNQIINTLGLNSADISFYLTAENAATGNNPISNPTTFNNTTNPQTIYARAVGTDGSCGGIATFEIETETVPVFELPDFLTFCDYDEFKSYTFHQPYYS